MAAVELSPGRGLAVRMVNQGPCQFARRPLNRWQCMAAGRPLALSAANCAPASAASPKHQTDCLIT